MILKTRQLLGRPVKTRAGKILGRVRELEWETNSLTVARLLVSNQKWWKKLAAADLVIAREQIIEINEQAVIVDDAVVAIAAAAGEPA